VLVIDGGKDHNYCFGSAVVYTLEALIVVALACCLLDCHFLFAICTCTDLEWLQLYPAAPPFHVLSRAE
jgi:hypothetical protein